MVRMTQEQYEDITSGESSETRLSPDLRYIIGIDPGKTTGLAVWDREAEGFDLVESTDFWGCLEVVTIAYDPDEAGVVIEDPNQHEMTVYTGQGLRGKPEPVAHKIAAGVGSNRREAELLIEAFWDAGYSVVPVKPQSSKWDAEYCERVTGWTGPPQNQHVRDSIALCFQQ